MFAGKLLDNFSYLEHILRLDDSGVHSHTVHLVCRQPTPPSTPVPSTSSASFGLRQRNTDQSGGPSPVTASSRNANDEVEEAPPFDHHHHQYQAYQQMMAAALQAHQEGGQQQSQDNVSTCANRKRTLQLLVRSSDAILSLYQAYYMMYAQYLTQYMQYVQQHGNLHSAAGVGGPASAYFERRVEQQPAAQRQPNDPAAQVNNIGVNGRGAIGGMEEEDDDFNGQRDVLDWFYIASRVLVLFSIVYFYSSFARFAFVTALGLIAYFWNTGLFRRRRQLRQGQRQQQQPRDVPPEEEHERAPLPPTDQLPPNDIQDEQEADGLHQHPLSTAITFITTFFTSLLPEQLQVV